MLSVSSTADNVQCRILDATERETKRRDGYPDSTNESKLHGYLYGLNLYILISETLLHKQSVKKQTLFAVSTVAKLICLQRKRSNSLPSEQSTKFIHAVLKQDTEKRASSQCCTSINYPQLRLSIEALSACLHF